MPPTPYQGYQPAPSPMAYGMPGGPQFATFDDPSSKRLMNEDSLPYMPSWDTAAKRRVEDSTIPPQENNNGDLEMGRMQSQPLGTRGGYNSVPNPALSPSPQAQPDYFHNAAGMNHAYNPDLGDQRLLGNEGRDAFQAVSLSPPPTYRSNSAAPSMAGDQFIASAPSPNEYSRGHLYRPQPQRQPSYQDTSTQGSVSTIYEASQNDHMSNANRISMPTPFNPAPTAQSHVPYQARPPSFLQVGRKPVNGSFREV